MDFDREVPPATVAQLRFFGPNGPRPPVFTAPGVLDSQTLRGVRQLTTASTQLLDALLPAMSPLPLASAQSA